MLGVNMPRMRSVIATEYGVERVMLTFNLVSSHRKRT